MRLWALAVVSFCILAVVASCSREGRTTQAGDSAKAAEQFVELLSRGDFATAAGSFDAKMKQALPPEKLQEAWASVTAKLGAFKRQDGARTGVEQGYSVAYVACEFEKGPLDAKVVFDSSGQVSGLWFVPHQ